MVPKMCSHNKTCELVTLALVGGGLMGEVWKSSKKTINRREKQ